MDAVQVHDWIDRLQRPSLPRLDLISHCIGHRRNQAGRDLGAVHLLQMALNLTYRHATGVQRDDFVVEPCPAGLVLGNELRLKAAVAVAGYLDGQFAEITQLIDACTHWNNPFQLPELSSRVPTMHHCWHPNAVLVHYIKNLLPVGRRFSNIRTAGLTSALPLPAPLGRSFTCPARECSEVPCGVDKPVQTQMHRPAVLALHSPAPAVPLRQAHQWVRTWTV